MSNWLVRTMAAAWRPYRLRLEDMDLVRAQFGAFLQQIPLLYLILAGNAAAVAFSARSIDAPVLTRFVPAILCLVAVTRGVWWWRRRSLAFSDVQIRRHIRVTSALSVALSAAFVGWILLLYPLGDSWQRGHFAFFLAITQVCCVFCLMPVRSAALGVATIGMVPFTVFFLFADHGRMWAEAVNFALVGPGMVTILLRYNHSFAELIRSQRDLRVGQCEAELLSEENRRIALTDMLSGLPNRRALIARLEEIHARPAHVADAVAILFLDLDGFKKINDDFGHQLGDALIRQLSGEIAAITPDDAMLVRMGGDEFAVLVEATPATPRAARAGATDRAVAVAEHILVRLALPITVEGHALQVGASIGIAANTFGDGIEAIDPYELLRRADTAMYRAKAGGRAPVLVYDPSFDEGRLERQRIEVEIRRGLAGREFDVAYQPLVEADSGAVVGVEALVRWPGRIGGPLAPDSFIGVAEASGLIQPLGLFVLARACQEVKVHQGLRLHVNVSPAQFRYPGFEQEVAQILADSGFPPDRLQIEITEGYLIDHPERASRAILAFRAMGVGVALDDFGSGFASIGYLRRFGFNAIKIDKSLSHGLGVNSQASALITGMVHLANGLDMRVTAEGVETEAQAALLRLAGCHELQGYLFGRPASLVELLGRRLIPDAAAQRRA